MKNITFTIVGLGLLLAGSAHAATVGNFGPYATVNSNEAVSTGKQVEVSAEGRLSAYAPTVDVAQSNTQVAVSSEGRLNAYGS